MEERERLEAEYKSINKDYNALGYKLKAIYGFNEKGQLKVVQFFASKRGSIIHGHLQTSSFLISKLLQYNVSVESIAKRLEEFDYDPNGFCNGKQYKSFAHLIAELIRENKVYKEPTNGS